MAKKVTIKGQNKLNSLDDDWGGVNETTSTQKVYDTDVPPGAEWGMNRGEVERFVKEKLSEHDEGIAGSVKGVSVNGSVVEPDGNGIAEIEIPPVDDSLDEQSNHAVQNSVVAANINSLKTAKVGGMRTDPLPSDPGKLMLVIENDNGDEVASCAIPKASDGENETHPRVTVNVSSQRVKRGNQVTLTWRYNHYNGDGTPTGTAAQTITIRAVNGSTEIYREVVNNVADNIMAMI